MEGSLERGSIYLQLFGWETDEGPFHFDAQEIVHLIVYLQKRENEALNTEENCPRDDSLNDSALYRRSPRRFTRISIGTSQRP